MRKGVFFAGLVLLVLATVPAYLAQQFLLRQEEKRKKRGYVDAPFGPAQTKKTSEIVQEGANSQAVRPSPKKEPIEPVHPPTKDTQQVGVERKQTLWGSIRGERRKILPAETLVLGAEPRSYSAITDEWGEFKIEYTASDSPLILANSDGLPLYVANSEGARETAPDYLNLQFLLPTKRFGGLLQPRFIQAERLAEQGGLRILVRVGSELPAGETVYVDLLCDQRSIASTIEQSQNPEFEARLQTAPGEFHSGVYSIRVSWRPSSASEAVRMEVKEFVNAQLPAELRVERKIYIGRVAEEDLQKKAVVEFAQAALFEAQAARDLLLYAAWNIRGATKKVKIPQPGPEWRDAQLLYGDSKRVALVNRYAPAKSFAQILRGGKLNLGKWRSFIDQELPERWAVYRDKGKFPFPDLQSSLSVNVPRLFDEINKLYKAESRLIYSSFNQAPHVNDHYESEWGPDETRRQTLTRINTLFKTIKAEIKKVGN